MSATCARHPERPALGPCSRCGTFLCDACAVEKTPPTCADCDLVRYDARALADRRTRAWRLMGVGVLLWLGAVGLMVIQLSAGVLHNYALGGAIAAATFGTVLVAGAVMQRMRSRAESTADFSAPARAGRYPALTVANVQAQRARGRPFSVCVGCRVVFPEVVVSRCLQCNSAADCVEVASADDARMVLATLA